MSGIDETIPANNWQQASNNFIKFKLEKNQDFNVFQSIMQQKGITDEALINKAFSIFDKDHNGELNEEEVYCSLEYFDSHGSENNMNAQSKKQNPTILDGKIDSEEVKKCLEDKNFEGNYDKFSNFLTTRDNFKIAKAKKRLISNHQENLKNIEPDLSNARLNKNVEDFKKHYAKNHNVYEEVSNQTGISPEVIAAIHFKEASGNFNTLLSDGWESIGFVNMAIGETEESKWIEQTVSILKHDAKKCDYEELKKHDPNGADLTFAELHNGAGYSNMGLNSPYIYNGSNKQNSGFQFDQTGNKVPVTPAPGIWVLMNSVKPKQRPEAVEKIELELKPEIKIESKTEFKPELKLKKFQD